jgi:predicted dehydrogenase
VVAAKAVTTPGHKMETEDFASALVRLGNGAPGTVIATTAAYPGNSERIEIIGTRGTASLVGGSLQLSTIGGGAENLIAEASTGSGASIMDFPNDAHRAVLADFLDAIEQDRDPVVTGEEALATQRLITDILAAAGWRTAA